MMIKHLPNDPIGNFVSHVLTYLKTAWYSREPNLTYLVVKLALVMAGLVAVGLAVMISCFRIREWWDSWRYQRRIAREKMTKERQ